MIKLTNGILGFIVFSTYAIIIFYFLFEISFNFLKKITFEIINILKNKNTNMYN